MTNAKETENGEISFSDTADFGHNSEDKINMRADESPKGNNGSNTKKKRDTTHLGHRERLRLKAAEFGFEFLEKHEQLEMILFACQKIGNTNEVAHDLIKRFGSLDNVLHATKEELTEVKGVGASRADFIMWLPSYVGMFERAAMEKNRRTCLKTEQDVINYVKTFFYDKDVENIYLVSLSASSNVCGVSKLSSGIRNSADVTMHKVAGAAIRHGACEVVLAHNHPSGDPTPSIEDIRMTKMLRDGLAQLRIRLKMHVIVACGQCEIINDARLNMYGGSEF